MTEPTGAGDAAQLKAMRTSDIDGRITDEDIARAQRQVGVPQFVRTKTYNPVADASSISHFAYGNGDDNPLYHDEAYGRSTRWGGLIAPPLYPISAGVCVTPKYDAELKALFRGLFRGVGKYHTASDWQWYRPIYPGDALFFDHVTTTVDVRPTSFGKGQSVVEVYRTLYANRLGEIVAVRSESFASIERRGSKEGRKYADFRPARYSDEDLAKIDAIYAAESRRGATPRHHDEVTEGELLQPVAKGPLTVTDVMFSHMARGWGGYGIGPLRYAWQQRQQMPAFFAKDPHGVPDNVQRMHWDPYWAGRIGLPAPIDYGQNRLSWLTHLVTNWAGDDAWLASLHIEFREFNFLGDFSTCTGKVARLATDAAQCYAELDLECRNQRGVLTSPGHARVILPSKAHSAVLLPAPPVELAQYGARMMSEFARRQARAKR